jgi:hypothetical protein
MFVATVSYSLPKETRTSIGIFPPTIYISTIRTAILISQELAGEIKLTLLLFPLYLLVQILQQYPYLTILPLILSEWGYYGEVRTYG